MSRTFVWPNLSNLSKVGSIVKCFFDWAVEMRLSDQKLRKQKTPICRNRGGRTGSGWVVLRGECLPGNRASSNADRLLKRGDREELDVRLPLRRQLKELDAGPLAAVDVDLERRVVALREADQPTDALNALHLLLLRLHLLLAESEGSG